MSALLQKLANTIDFVLDKVKLLEKILDTFSQGFNFSAGLEELLVNKIDAVVNDPENIMAKAAQKVEGFVDKLQGFQNKSVKVVKLLDQVSDVEKLGKKINSTAKIITDKAMIIPQTLKNNMARIKDQIKDSMGMLDNLNQMDSLGGDMLGNWNQMGSFMNIGDSLVGLPAVPGAGGRRRLQASNPFAVFESIQGQLSQLTTLQETLAQISAAAKAVANGKAQASDFFPAAQAAASSGTTTATTSPSSGAAGNRRLQDGGAAAQGQAAATGAGGAAAGIAAGALALPDLAGMQGSLVSLSEQALPCLSSLDQFTGMAGKISENQAKLAEFIEKADKTIAQIEDAKAKFEKIQSIVDTVTDTFDKYDEMLNSSTRLKNEIQKKIAPLMSKIEDAVMAFAGKLLAKMVGEDVLAAMKAVASANCVDEADCNHRRQMQEHHEYRIRRRRLQGDEVEEVDQASQLASSV